MTQKIKESLESSYSIFNKITICTYRIDTKQKGKGEDGDRARPSGKNNP
jgi:hypothetical protein